MDSIGEARVGARLSDEWTLLRVLGAGGSATVYEAEHVDGRRAAAKLMHVHLSGEWLARFEREARVLAELDDSRLPRLYAFGQAFGVPYLLLELCVGASLEVHLNRAQRLQLPQVLSWADSALRALAVVHRHGVVHRDLKPSNLFVTEDGSIKLLDFGIASLRHGPLDVTTPTTRGLLGTPAFMSPEQARGRWDLVDARSDLWSLAAVLFTLLSGEHVHPAPTPNEQLGLAMSQTARSLAEFPAFAGTAIARVLERALAYDPARRFQSADALRLALAHPSCLEVEVASDAAAGEVCQTERDATPPRKQRRLESWLAIGIATAALVAGAVVPRASSGRPAARDSVPTSSPPPSFAPPGTEPPSVHDSPQAEVVTTRLEPTSHPSQPARRSLPRWSYRRALTPTPAASELIATAAPTASSEPPAETNPLDLRGKRLELRREDLALTPDVDPLDSRR